jgi:valyl-tRNA synthetase
MADTYEPRTIEPKWQDQWETLGVHHFKWPSDRPIFSIDVPPRYANAALHLGHATSYSHIDFLARYKRMRGFNVFNPLCADTNGMPIEIAVEKRHKITKKTLPRQEYLKLCTQFANENIGAMTKQFKALGHSFDKNLFYQTDSPAYRKITQITFLRMLEKGLVYKGTAPVIWCPTCITAIADPEMEHKTRTTTLNTIKFTESTSGKTVEIATTRPELICTCQLVAVHPEDPRYFDLVGKELLTPVYKRPVKVVADGSVDKEFGTGVVMICSVGDTGDLEWIYRYGLKFEKGIDEEGRMTELAGKLVGMPVAEAKKAIIEEMRTTGELLRQAPLEQNVGTCWRCHNPTEFLLKTQWFLKTLDFKDDVLAASKTMNWHPKHMESRLINWVTSLNRDWVISRQRLFATPIPIWECEKCGKIVPAKESQCYIDPTRDKAPAGACPECGGSLRGSEEVFDTWMDSSISPLYNSFWLRDEEKFKAIYPMSVRPQAHEIIRTWTFYTILRCLQITGKRPWGETMISGFIMAPDGTPMHTSLGNVVDPIPLLEQYGADSMRYFAATCTLGVDQAFQVKEVVHGQKLCNKLWNVCKFVGLSVKGKPEAKAADLKPADLWILSKYSRTVEAATKAMEDCQFDVALRTVEQFLWHEFADHYLEMAKHRMASGDKGVQYSLYTISLGVLKMLTPIMPHIADEIYHSQYIQTEPWLSITIAPWPEPVLFDDDEEERGDLLRDVIAGVRSWKSDNRMALNAELAAIEISGDGSAALLGCEDDIIGTLKIKRLVITQDSVVEEVPTAIKPNKATIGPKFRGKAKDVYDALAGMPVEDAAGALETGHLMLTFEDGTQAELAKEDVKIEKGLKSHGKMVNSVSVRGLTILVEAR